MKRRSFSLAEGLITLTIIGVVSVLVIPTLYAKYQKQVFATKLSKAYNRIVAGSVVIDKEIGDVNYYVTYSKPYDEWMRFMSSVREAFAHGSGGELCEIPGGHGDVYYEYPACKYATNKRTKIYPYTSLNGEPPPYNTAPLKLSSMPHQYGSLFTYPDGMAISLSHAYAGPGATNWDMIHAKMSRMFFIDLNGMSAPNTIGRDIFFAVQYTTKKVPVLYGFDNPDDCVPGGVGLKCGGKIQKDGWKMNY